MLEIWIGRAGTGKTARILGKIRDLGDGGRQALLVPEHASYQAEVDLCRVCGDTVSRHAEVLSFRRLSDRVLALTGGLAQPSLDAGGELLTLQRCVSELSPVLTVYRRPSRKAAFLSRMLDLFDEFRAYEASPETLLSEAEAIGGATGEKLRDLGLIFAAYEARLRGGGRDARDRMSRLRDALEGSRWAVGKDVFLDGFTYFNALERSIVGILLRQARSVTVTLLGEPGGREEIFDPTVRTLGQLRRVAEREGVPVEVVGIEAAPEGALGHLERHAFGEAVPLEGPQEAVRIREARDALSEVERTAADIVRLAASGRARFRDITVTARDMESYEGLIGTVFARWGIPAYLSRRSDILERPVMGLLTGALSAVTGGYEHEDLFRALKTGLAGLTPDECDLLEGYVQTWDIHGSMWIRDVLWTASPDGYGVPMTEERQERLDQINALRERVRIPLAGLARGLREGRTVREKVDALYGFMESLGLQAALEEQRQRQAEAGDLQSAEETAQIWEVLCGILDQAVEILGDEELDADRFARLFRQAASQYSVGSIPASLDQVSVTGMSRNERRRSRYVFLLGANDHVIPTAGQSGGILDEDDRAALALRGVELAPTGMEQMGMELLELYAVLAQPTEGLTVSYPLADTAGTALRPAFIVPRILSLFPDLRVETEDPDGSWRLTAPVPALEAAASDPGGPLWRWFRETGRYDRALDAMERAASWRRGALSRGAVRELYGERISLSASRLERMRTCHFAYFMEYGLRARPGRPAAFDAPQIGVFLHYLLEHVTRDALAMGGFARVTDEELRERTDHYIRRFAEEELDGLRGKGARFRYLFRRLRDTAWSVVRQTAEELRHSDFVPLAYELSFGDGQAVPAVRIWEPGAETRIGGKVDRADGWIRDGKLYLRVVDYKSGKRKFDLGAVRMGLDIQMLLYLFALERNGRAWAGREIVPAGALYLPARDEILEAPRDIGPEALERMREKELRRSGLLLSDPEVLRAMEHESLTDPHYLPIRVGKDGALSGDIASAEQLGKLGRYVDGLVARIAGELRRGVIDADPCSRGPEDRPCRYCDWASACWFQEGRDGDRERRIRPLTREEFWEAVEAETGPTPDGP